MSGNGKGYFFCGIRFFILCAVFMLIFAVAASAEELLFENAEEESSYLFSHPTLSKENEVLEFTPEGYYPEAECSVEELKINISYFAVDASTGESVALPIYGVGEFNIIAILAESESYERTECSWTVTINPLRAVIVTEYHTAAHTAMANPISYYVEPAFAEEYLDIEISYKAIDDLNDGEGDAINVPVRPGLYYTLFTVESLSEGIICEDKCLVYEIAERKGGKLGEAAARASVPDWFRLEVEDITALYSGESVSPSFASYPAAAEGYLLYSELNPDGSRDEYTREAPTEPGDYEVLGFILGKEAGRGKVVIDKIVPKIELSSASYIYIPEGIYPSFAVTEPSDIEITYIAYPVLENGEIGVSSVPVPIIGCGRYMILASPADTVHYELVYAHTIITIEEETPLIDTEDREYFYDGEEKEAAFAVSPDWAEYKVEYSKIDKYGALIERLGSERPYEVGSYIAVITVAERDYISSATAMARIYILPARETSEEPQEPFAEKPRGASELFRINVAFSFFAVLWLILALAKKNNSGFWNIM